MIQAHATKMKEPRLGQGRPLKVPASRAAARIVTTRTNGGLLIAPHVRRRKPPILDPLKADGKPLLPGAWKTIWPLRKGGTAKNPDLLYECATLCLRWTL